MYLTVCLRVQLAAEALSDDAVPLRIQLMAPPLYVMIAMTLDKAAGIERMHKAIQVRTKTHMAGTVHTCVIRACLMEGG